MTRQWLAWWDLITILNQGLHLISNYVHQLILLHRRMPINPTLKPENLLTNPFLKLTKCYWVLSKWLPVVFVILYLNWPNLVMKLILAMICDQRLSFINLHIFHLFINMLVYESLWFCWQTGLKNSLAEGPVNVKGPKS